MSYGGFEYNDGGGGYGGFDVMNGAGFGGDMGGGFMGGSAATPKSADKKASRDRQSLIPFTAKQLINASQDPSGDLLKIDGTEVHTVKIMGIVEMVEEHATNITYRVNDGTGVIECKLWVEKDGGSKHHTCSQFSYVQVFGSLKTYEGVNHILVYKCTPVEDFNEMTHHFLDVILTHLQNTKGPIPGSKAAGSSRVAMSPGGGIGHFGMQGQFSPGFPMTPGQSLQSSMASGGNETFYQKVLDVIRRHGESHVGLSIVDTHARLGQGSLQSVREAVLHLAGEGVIYSTLDEEHYKSTD